MRKAGICLIVILLSVTISCDHREVQKISLDKEYQGFWASTGWSYTFDKDRKFLFKYEGHFGFGADSGRYTIVDDILLLIPDTDWEAIPHGVLKEKIRIVNADCIRDFDNNYYCLDLDSMSYYNEFKYSFEEKIKNALDSLPMVKEEKRRLLTYEDILTSGFEPRIEYNRIIVVKKAEYHSFSLTHFTGTETTYYLNFLVKDNPFQIYEHHSKGDSLSLIDLGQKLPPTSH